MCNSLQNGLVLSVTLIPVSDVMWEAELIPEGVALRYNNSETLIPPSEDGDMIHPVSGLIIFMSEH